jgi:hypothetical protein
MGHSPVGTEFVFVFLSLDCTMRSTKNPEFDHLETTLAKIKANLAVQVSWVSFRARIRRPLYDRANHRYTGLEYEGGRDYRHL